ncbi:EamA family transporter [Prauserella muralis]|uniref:EamA family transporter n=1 Tax=Prauserella muralis TaxID=588067 RepID=UPI0011ADB533|nr:EamA family transporter [Prauserella muralis]TWE27942.1 inner membrane transporter RhtA [Prauserella muralis]
MAKLDTAGRPAVSAPGHGAPLGSVALVLGGALSLQFGAAVAALLFDRAGSLGVVTLRLGFAAVLLCLLLRPRVRGYSRADWAAVAAFGLTLAGMNTLFYQAIERIPLGPAVTLEVLGPLVLSVVASRRPMSVLWAVLALGGVFLLGRGGFAELDGAGVAFALCAGVLWATYIVLSARVGSRFPKADGVALALVIGGLATLPLGVAASGAALLDPLTLVLGAAVAVLSSMLPYTLELLALRKLAASTFAVLMSLEPALAALAGFLVLRQGLSPLQSLGIALVIAASVGAVRMRKVGGRERDARVAERGGGESGPLPGDAGRAPGRGACGPGGTADGVRRPVAPGADPGR